MLEARRFGDAGAHGRSSRSASSAARSRVLALTDGKRARGAAGGRGSQDDLRRRSRARTPAAWARCRRRGRATTSSTRITQRDPRADGARPRRRRHRLSRRAVRRRDGRRRRARRGCSSTTAGSAIPRRSRSWRAWSATSARCSPARARGEMPVGVLAWDARVAVCVVVAAAGYPGAVRTGDPIGGLDATRPTTSSCSMPGPARKDGQLVTAGGRVLGVTALGVSVAAGARPGVRGRRRDRARGQAGAPRHRRALTLSNVARMPQIAGFRGALWNPPKVDLARSSPSPLTNVQGAPRERRARPRSRRARCIATTRCSTHGGRTVTRTTLVVRGAARRRGPRASIRAARGDRRRPRATRRPRRSTKRARTPSPCSPAIATPRARSIGCFAASTASRPTLEVTTPDGTVHRLWRVASAEVIGKLRPLFAPKKLHVLDGHARYEGMLAYARQARRRRAAAVLVGELRRSRASSNLDDPALVVAPRHRVDPRRRHQARRRARGREASTSSSRSSPARRRTSRKPAAPRSPTRSRTSRRSSRVFAGDADAWKLTLKPDVSPVGEGVAGPSRDAEARSGRGRAAVPRGACCRRDGRRPSVDAARPCSAVANGAQRSA